MRVSISNKIINIYFCFYILLNSHLSTLYLIFIGGNYLVLPVQIYVGVQLFIQPCRLYLVLVETNTFFCRSVLITSQIEVLAKLLANFRILDLGFSG